MKDIKEVRRARLTEYAKERPSAEYHEGSVWELEQAADIALPCATQNEIDDKKAAILVKNGVKVVAEGANMPSTMAAIKLYHEKGVLYGPGKAANAGGVAVSALEMSQNSQRLVWSKEEVDGKLDDIMKNIYETCRDTAAKYADKDNFAAGANIAGFEKVAAAMLAQGTV